MTRDHIVVGGDRDMEDTVWRWTFGESVSFMTVVKLTDIWYLCM